MKETCTKYNIEKEMISIFSQKISEVNQSKESEQECNEERAQRLSRNMAGKFII